MTRPRWCVEERELSSHDGALGEVRRKANGLWHYDYYGLIAGFWIWLAPFGNRLPPNFELDEPVA